MKPTLLAALLFGGLAWAAEPVTAVWHLTPASLRGQAGATPEVHSVEIQADYVVVRSHGVSLAYLGPLQASPAPSEAVREFEFHIPRHPHPQQGEHAHVGAGVIGVFVNGMPIYNQFEADSYQGQNLWHLDPIEAGRQGESPAGLIERLAASPGSHSPLIGYALDGYPIYGPWGFGADSQLHRMRSGYRLRHIAERTCWPDGTSLTPGQYGPPVNSQFPLGTFVEDYEYVAGSGDLDQYNGRFAHTPEYPDGTYAYFLATGDAARTAFPYLLASEFYGDAGIRPIQPKTIALTRTGAGLRLEMPARHLEYVHEKPIHMMVVSADLIDFAHIHPELAADGAWEVPYTFPHGGQFRVYIEYTPPGQGQQVQFFDLNVEGAPASAPPPVSANRAGVTFTAPVLRAGEDIELCFRIADGARLQPYLGAWAHFTLIGEGLSAFIHAHPMGDAPETAVHTHALGPSAPAELHTVVSFPHAGVYKLWAQFQVDGKVEATPFVLHVDPPAEPVHVTRAAEPPAGAIRVNVTTSGFEPARIEVAKDAPVQLWFTRTGEPNCGRQVVFPALHLTRDLPLGGTVLVELPPQSSGELRFSCGMNMYRGMIVVH